MPELCAPCWFSQVLVVAVWPGSLAASCLQMNEEHRGAERRS